MPCTGTCPVYAINAKLIQDRKKTYFILNYLYCDNQYFLYLCLKARQLNDLLMIAGSIKFQRFDP